MVHNLLTVQRGRIAWDWTDWVAHLYLLAGVVLMFGPIAWLGVSSLKSETGLNLFPPTFLPYEQATIDVPERGTLRLFTVTKGEYTGMALAELRRIGRVAQLIDPAHPEAIIRLPVADREPLMRVRVAAENYSGLFRQFNFLRYFWNSSFITIVAIVLVPNYLIAAELGLTNSLWGVIWPAVATPTGVFLLRQYMLTLPDELIEAARMDNASEWRIYWRIILPLSAPALAVLAIFSVMWRWNEFLWPMVVLSRSEVYTLPLALNSFQGELTTQWNYLLAMTVVTLVPITVIFAILQKHITQGIASAGVK